MTQEIKNERIAMVMYASKRGVIAATLVAALILVIGAIVYLQSRTSGKVEEATKVAGDLPAATKSEAPARKTTLTSSEQSESDRWWSAQEPRNGSVSVSGRCGLSIQGSSVRCTVDGKPVEKLETKPNASVQQTAVVTYFGWAQFATDSSVDVTIDGVGKLYFQGAGRVLVSDTGRVRIVGKGKATATGCSTVEALEEVELTARSCGVVIARDRSRVLAEKCHEAVCLDESFTGASNCWQVTAKGKSRVNAHQCEVAFASENSYFIFRDCIPDQIFQADNAVVQRRP